MTPPLGETLGLELELKGTEIDAGTLRADLLCKDVREGRLFLINVVAKPNEWSRSARVVASDELTGIGNKRLAYWTAFKEILDCHPYPKN